MSTETARTAQQVFVCYRREGSAAHAGRVYDAMVARFGERNVFMDVDMEPGVDFVERITEVVSGCVALIAVMDPTWATVTDEDGGCRIHDEDDFVRLEIETALRHGARVIPLLVHGARMPRREELPAGLAPLARRNALEMSDGRWRYDVGRLLTALDEMLPAQEATRPAAVEPVAMGLDPQPPPSQPWRLVVEGMVVAGVTSAAVRAVAWQIPLEPDKQEPASSGETVAQIAAMVGRQAGTGALAGAAVAIWLAYRLGRSGNLLWLRGLLVGALAGALGGLVLGLLTYLPEKNLDVEERNQAALLAVPVTGALFGALIGSLWRPPRIGVAFLGGAAGGLLFQLFSVAAGLDTRSTGSVDLNFGLAAAAIAGVALAAMVVLDAAGPRRSRAAGEGRVSPP